MFDLAEFGIKCGGEVAFSVEIFVFLNAFDDQALSLFQQVFLAGCRALQGRVSVFNTVVAPVEVCGVDGDRSVFVPDFVELHVGHLQVDEAPLLRQSVLHHRA